MSTTTTLSKTTTGTYSSSAAAAAAENERNKSKVDDMFDLFSSSVSPMVTTTAATHAATTTTTSTRGYEQQDWDDNEGYYKAVIGEVFPLPKHHYELRVSGVIGKGVFSTVLKCNTTTISFPPTKTTRGNQHHDDDDDDDDETSKAVDLPSIVALKCIRHNDTMAKAALREIAFLLKLKEDKAAGIVPLLLPHHVTKPMEYRGHTLLVFPYLPYNLRDVLQKFGKGVGLSLQSVQAYFGQLLSALYHLQKRHLIHADIKPDNILVSENYSTVLLCDFGSAVEMNSTDHLPTPYLVSRFYRAPEVILGLLPTTAIDLWSVAISMAEIFLGSVVLAGTTNNDMLFQMMQHQLGPFSHRLVRQHVLACQKLGLTGTAVHFAMEDNVYQFLQQTNDPVSGQAVVRHVPLLDHGNISSSTNNTSSSTTTTTTRSLKARLLKAKSAKDSRTKVLQFAELLQKCLALDPTRRISVKEALHHSFFTSNG